MTIAASNPAQGCTEDSAAVSDAEGNYTASVYTGGSYVLTVDTTKDEGGQIVRYQGTAQVALPIVSGPKSVTVTVTREVVGVGG